jgi:hypothetical protein
MTQIAAAPPPFHIAILGGGTAGWMAACLIGHHWPRERVAVTVVESPDIGIIGVGEGSTPQLAAFMAKLGIADADWMPRCNATYKAGIRFHGWSEAPGFASYFHPFATELDSHTMPSFHHHTRLRRGDMDVWAHPDRFSLSARLAERGLAPLPTDNFPFAVGYGYHFDATLVGQMLREIAVERLGVVHRPAMVRDIERSTAGNIAALILDDASTLPADFFLDGSGFRAMLIEEALGERFISFGDNLFNDRAVAMPTPRADGPLRAQTSATTLSNGWAWHIPLTNRTGNGYVYSSAHLSPDQAEAELRTHLGSNAGEARHLQMKVGRMANSWVHNCLAIGLSQGFIEPLEATALHIVQATIEGFIAAFDAGDFTPQHRDAFNADINARYDGIRDYIVCHYRVNRRTDTDYWRANAANQHLSDSLKAIITCWFTGGDLAREIEEQKIGRYYAPLSWHCLLAGYGTYPDTARLKPPPPHIPVADMARIDDFIDRCARNFGDHATALLQHSL